MSFTFGLARPDTGSVVAQSVTTPSEALAAAEIGADLLIVQGPAADGHSATLTPDHPLVPINLPDLVSDIWHTVDMIAKSFPHIRGIDTRSALAELPELRQLAARAEEFGSLVELAGRAGAEPCEAPVRCDLV